MGGRTLTRRTVLPDQREEKKNKKVGIQNPKTLYSQTEFHSQQTGPTTNKIFIYYLTIHMENMLNIKLNQLHAVSSTQQVKQREPSVKTLLSPLSAVFWRY